ncbi:hypothetical protein GCM10009792_18450 [Microcella alkalica]
MCPSAGSRTVEVAAVRDSEQVTSAVVVDVAFVEVNSLTRATTVLDFTVAVGDVSEKAVTCPSLGDRGDGQGRLTCFLDDRSGTGYVWITTVNRETGAFIYGPSRYTRDTVRAGHLSRDIGLGHRDIPRREMSDHQVLTCAAVMSAAVCLSPRGSARRTSARAASVAVATCPRR